MTAVTRLHRWDNVVASYLARRRALGRGYRTEEWMLRTVRRYLVAARSTDLDQEIFNRWRRSLRHLNPNTRRAREIAVYNLCRYRRRDDPHCFLPNPMSFTQRRPYRLPVLLEPAQIARLLATASGLRTRYSSSIYPSVMRIAVVLLYTAGLRRQELARLRLEDVNPDAGTLHIRASKFHKSRWLPLSLSACEELRRYLMVRRKTLHGTERALFI
jgi:integrase/recombinase XerD